MVILICEKVPDGLRGELSRWMIEPKTNVFVGRMSALVRDKLWQRVQDKLKGGAAIMAYPTNTEQGFTIKSCGDTTRELVSYDGLMLVKIPTPTSKARRNQLEASERLVPTLAGMPCPTSEMRRLLIEAGENPELW
jgi:CRISPR-associated protein Cas2